MHTKQFKKHSLPTNEIKYYNVTVDGQNFLDQPIENYLRTFDDIEKLAMRS